MKLFKSICSSALVLVVLFSMGVCAFASGYTYSITIPDGFKEKSTTVKNEEKWENDDYVEISVHCQPNNKEDKVNPLEANLTAFEQDFRLGMTEKGYEVTSIDTKLVEVGEHHAINVSMALKVAIIGEVYYVYYIFETQNYIHTFVVQSLEDKSDFAESLISTVVINDEPAKLLNANKTVARIIAGAITGAIIGAAVALILLIARKTSGKNVQTETLTGEPAVTLTPDFWSDMPKKAEEPAEEAKTFDE